MGNWRPLLLSCKNRVIVVVGKLLEERREDRVEVTQEMLVVKEMEPSLEVCRWGGRSDQGWVRGCGVLGASVAWGSGSEGPRGGKGTAD